MILRRFLHTEPDVAEPELAGGGVNGEEGVGARG